VLFVKVVLILVVDNHWALVQEDHLRKSVFDHIILRVVVPCVASHSQNVAAAVRHNVCHSNHERAAAELTAVDALVELVKSIMSLEK
jgi:hypothetical protein